VASPVVLFFPAIFERLLGGGVSRRQSGHEPQRYLGHLGGGSFPF
jgi:hypothetical protein